MTTENLLELALSVALKAHTGDKDYDEKPVILHPIAVGMMGRTEDEIIVGFLHDVIEDSDITGDDLRKEFPDELVDAVELLTNDLESYDAYIQRLIDSNNQLALQVKVFDLTHNSSRANKSGIERLVSKYHRALAMIKEAHPHLYQPIIH